MPLFEYKCADCGETFEELVSGDKKVICPKCQSSETEKLLSTFAAAMGSGSSSGQSAPACGRGGFG